MKYISWYANKWENVFQTLGFSKIYIPLYPFSLKIKKSMYSGYVKDL